MTVGVFFVLASILNFSTVRAACSAGASASGGLCFIAGRGYVNWFKANILCEVEGCILNYSENATVQSKISSFAESTIGSENYWVGINDQLEEGTWVMSDGTESTDIPWVSGGPTTGDNSKNCGQVTSSEEYAVDDARCTNTKKYICLCT